MKAPLFLLAFGLLVASAGAAYGQTPSEPAQDSMVSHHEFSYRMQLAYDRMTEPRFHPIFDEPFILADVCLDPNNPRRFYNFSGDLSGRFFEVMAASAGHRADYHQLMHEALKQQRPDGRFGDINLRFTADEIGGEHMALLWGNGRFLVGLMTYYRHFPNPEVLAAAVRLGDFFKHTYDACSTPEVADKLEGMGAKGIICFTQYIEGLVLLSEATGDRSYADAAAKTYHLIGDRGTQHSHGYLTTLRGVLMLYHYSGNHTYLQFVQQAVDALLASDDMTIYDSVKEYFGNIHDRDEGCSTADFLRLCLGLHLATGEMKYLQTAEHTLYNSLYFNQYTTGDFGHHNLHNRGSGPSTIMAAWWCCSMHGLRALQEVNQVYALHKTPAGYQLDLYLESDYNIEGLRASLRRKDMEGTDFRYQLDIHTIAANQPLRLRVPEWAEHMEVTRGGTTLATATQHGYITLPGLSSGDQLQIQLVAKVRVRTTDGSYVSIDDIGNQPVNGCLFVGPLMMGVEQSIDPEFAAEPNENTVLVDSLAFGNTHLYTVHTDYAHNGFPSTLQAAFTPVGQATFLGHSYQLVQMDFVRGHAAGVTDEQQRSILNPANN